MNIGDIVKLTDVDGIAGLIEDITAYEDGMTVYSIRCPYTGILFAREAGDLELADEDTVARIRQGMQYLTPVVAECEIMKIGDDGFIITRGMVNAEMARTARARKSMARSASPMLVIGLNASSNMFA